MNMRDPRFFQICMAGSRANLGFQCLEGWNTLLSGALEFGFPVGTLPFLPVGQWELSDPQAGPSLIGDLGRRGLEVRWIFSSFFRAASAREP